MGHGLLDPQKAGAKEEKVTIEPQSLVPIISTVAISIVLINH